MQNPFIDVSAETVDAEQLFLRQDERLLKAVRKIADVVPKAHLVGGFVRDALRGQVSKDADVEVYGMEPQALEVCLEKLFPGQVIAVGRSFGVLKVVLEDDLDVDVAIPRRESKSGQGHVGFLVESDPNMSLEDALRRRDFTMNAMAADPLTGELFDPYGGQRDLQAGVLRMVDPIRFQDDPLRVYRAIQFAARFEASIEPKTFACMRMMVQRGDLSELSKERVTDELRKLFLQASRPSLGLQIAWDLGVIERDYPELFCLKATPQEPEWHPEGDVWTHSLMVVDQAAKIIRQADRNFTEAEKLEVMLGALCHDLGKPGTTEVIDGRIRSRGHESAGEEPTKELLARWSFSQVIEHGTIMCVREHLKPGMLQREFEHGMLDEKKYTNAVRTLLRRIAPTSWRVLLAVAEADWRGRGLTNVEMEHYPYAEHFSQAVALGQLEDPSLKTLLHGRDILNLGVQPGPRVGELIQQIEAARDRGEIETKEQALEMLRLLIEHFN